MESERRAGGGQNVLEKHVFPAYGPVWTNQGSDSGVDSGVALRDRTQGSDSGVGFRGRIRGSDSGIGLRGRIQHSDSGIGFRSRIQKSDQMIGILNTNPEYDLECESSIRILNTNLTYES